ncbi:tRNA (adenosine(37)-N6)-threonylcarbamoyltransferase complex dimerization subunit type 1 TsaB [Salinibacterium sp. dk2585]|uniref:tRNA (adenosine(37)-N6)-threonylcarbamoyltransferase complex dimerization subunit type 1 TsaB n=1 Tax=unclassified Salinibacterium TaxID=2632331 RepID=UPI0011C24552|nr:MULTISPECIES: tRNA (adenosine(37)-N6)-threonylcarbamoyltransferase complex dimerization subunit type 1 TsaB [unclassified Salinibacterium]QEE60651.1 tRNA (adenosine(37)-N6)-threonylcarbamoyltransferase complex dimerization subunit type 1 TsaB [Salinibacterium sp. dk2585]TXK55723.1 tRNA (adenosine(37)-N6)-threonylcarbamoyltransferase complex dimerization subunit type 1 TsaB [Salinibacterium sp. dk5596]
MLLSIDTSAGTSVAVVDRDRGIIVELGESDTRRHAEVIGELIARCLEQAGIQVADLSGVAVGMGPGPFTGLRVGIAAAQAFALGAGRPVVRVVSHDAIAFQHYAAGGSGALLVVTDARRREVYWSAYSGADAEGLPVRSGGPALAAPAELPAEASTTRIDAAEVSAGAAGMLAELLYFHGRDFAGAEPLYLRSPDVTLSAGPKRVTG